VSNYVYMGATPAGLSIPVSAFRPGAFSKPIPLQNLGRMRFTAKDFTKAEQTQGRAYLAQQWVVQEQVVRNMRLRFAKPTASKNPDGKVSVPVTTFWSDWNAQTARAIQPVASAIRSLELLPRALREKMVTRPLDALLDIFNPLFDRVAAPCRRTMQQHLRGGRRVEWFGRYIDIRIEQPLIDNAADESTKTLLRKLRTIQAFIVCFLKKPVEFAGECLKEGIDIVGDVAGAVGQAVGNAVEAIGKAAQDAGKAVGDVAKKAADEAGKAVAGVASFFGNAFGLSGLGEAATGISGAVAAAITTIAGVITENVIIAIIGAIVTVIGAVIGAAAYVAVSFRQQESVEKAIEAGASAEMITENADGSKSVTRVGQASVQLPPGAAPPEALADDEVGPAGAPPPPDPETLRAESAAGAEPVEPAASSSSFVVPVAVAAGVALLLLARR
jgi:hypothetical protein